MRSRFRVSLRTLMVVVGIVAVFLGGVTTGVRWEASRKTLPVTMPKASSPTPPGVVTWDAAGNGVAYGYYTDPQGKTHRGTVITIIKGGIVMTD